jgi:hypothetical protein
MQIVSISRLRLDTVNIDRLWSDNVLNNSTLSVLAGNVWTLSAMAGKEGALTTLVYQQLCAHFTAIKLPCIGGRCSQWVAKSKL